MQRLIKLSQMFRVKQWIKNVFVFVPLLFSLKLLEIDAFLNILMATLNFCIVSSFIYIVNDWCDREADRKHKTKKYRPFASKQLGIRSMWAGLSFCAVLLISVYLLNPLNTNFYIVLALYGLNSIAYTYFLKNIELLEMFVVAIGYILRVIAGVTSINVLASPWIFLCTGSIALAIIGFKRRAEMLNARDGVQTRAALNKYSIEFINIYITVTLALTLISYTLFTISDYALSRYNSEFLPLSTLFVLFGVLRFCQINIVRTPNEDPISSIIHDKILMSCIFVWGIFILLILYKW